MRLLDRVTGRGTGFWEGTASGASILTTTYGTPDKEAILPVFAEFCKEVYSDNAVVFGAILARLMLFSEAAFKFQRLNDRSLFGTNDAGGLPILEEPWPNGTTGELLARMIQDVDLAGNAYVARGSDRLLRLRPDWVTIVSAVREDPATGNTFREPVGYIEDPERLPGGEPSEKAQTYTVDEVAHWSPIPDPLANFRGMSWLTPVIREVRADQAMTEYKHRYLNNAASPNMLVKYRQKLLPKSLDNVRELLEARYGGVGNAFKTLVLDQGADATVIGNSFEQMQFSTVQAAGENRILIASGVPGIVVGSKEGLDAATYSNYQQAMRRFADLTMRPLWRSVCASLAKLVFTPPNSRLWYDIVEIAALRAGEKERADMSFVQSQAIAQLTSAGYTLESARDAVVSGDMAQLQLPEPAAPTPVALAPAGPAGNGNGTPPGTPPAGPIHVPAHTRRPPVTVNGGG